MTNPADCEGCADVRENGGSTCGDCGTILPLKAPSAASLEKLRAAATDCARVADDYDAEGLHGIADRFREHAANLWRIAGEKDVTQGAVDAGAGG